MLTQKPKYVLMFHETAVIAYIGELKEDGTYRRVTHGDPKDMRFIFEALCDKADLASLKDE